MNSSSNGQKAAQVARDTASSKSGLYTTLSAQMCWDAVITCAHEAGAVSSKPSVTTENSSSFVTPQHSKVTSSTVMRSVPQGAFLGFFEGDKIIHAMISTGAGFAAGNKNSCIGIGAPVGWENLNVADTLRWQGDELSIGPRKIALHYRPL